MGLLDSFNNEDQLLMALSLMAAGAPKAQRTSLGEGLLGAFQAGRANQTAREDRDMRRQQFGLQQQQAQLALDQAKQQAADRQRQDAWYASIQPPQGTIPLPAGPYQGGAKDSQAANVPQPMAVDPNHQMLWGALQARAINPMQYHQALQKDSSPFILKEGELAYGRGPNGAPDFTKPLGGAPKNDQPAAVKEFIYAKTHDGYTGTFADWAREQANLKAPKTTVSITNAEKPFINTLGETLGKQLDSGLSQAKAAVNTIGTANSIRQALDSGKVITGPGASFKIAGLQIGQALGVGGKDAQEILANTRSVIQSMAQAELDAAQQMKGQGQITEAERDIIRRAASGNIDSLTTGEIRVLTDTMDKMARLKIQAHHKNLQSLQQMPNAAPLLPFYQVDMPAPYGASAPGAGRVRRYNPATGRIE